MNWSRVRGGLGWQRTLLGLVLALGSLGVLAGGASAAIYWANGNGVSRMNLDGTNPSPGLITGRTQPFGMPCGLAVDATHLYWADRFNDRIGRSGLDGSNREDDFIVGADEPCGVAVGDGYVYWANYGGTTIGRATVDGAEVQQDFVSELGRPCGVALNRDFLFWTGRIQTESGYRDVVGRSIRLNGEKLPYMVELDSGYGYCGVAADESHVYWGGYGDAIGRVGADGLDPEPRFITGLQSPCSVAIWDGKLYFGEISSWSGAGPIGRINLDGTGLEPQIAAAMEPCGIAVDSLSFGPSYVAVPPLPNWTPCTIVETKINTRNGRALVLLDGPAFGEVTLGTRGIRVRNLSPNPPPGVGIPASRRRWLRVEPRGRGPIARRLARTGKAPIRLRLTCSEEGNVTSQTNRRLVLRMPVHRRHKAHRHRRSPRAGRASGSTID